MYERPQIITLSTKKGGDEIDICGDPILFDNCDSAYCIGDSYCIFTGAYYVCVGNTWCFPSIMYN